MRPGPAFNLTNYNPNRDQLPPNRAARRALESYNRKAKKKRATLFDAKLQRLQAELLLLNERFKGRSNDEAFLREIIATARRVLALPELAAIEALKALGVLKQGPPPPNACADGS